MCFSFVIGQKITKFGVTVSQYLNSYSVNIEYKVVGWSMFEYQEVNNKGIDCGVVSQEINKSITVGDICAQHDSKHKQVVRMKDGLIHGIVAPGTKAYKLIGDGYTYRIDLYPVSQSCQNEEDTFHVCVRFIGNSSTERKKTPLLVKVKNGNTLYAIGLHLISIFGILNLQVLDDFQFFIDGKPVQREHKLIAPENPESIQVISLNMSRSKYPQPSHSYRNHSKI